MPTIANTSTREATGGLIIRQNVGGLLQDLISPKVPVNKKTGKYYKYDNSHFRLESDEYTTRGGANEISRDFTTANYDIKGYAFKEWLDGDVLDDADAAIKPELKQSIIMGITDSLMLKSEKRLADLLFNSANFSGKTDALTGSDRWNDGTSNPLVPFKAASRAVLLNGKNPVKTLILGFDAWQGLQYNESMLDLLSNNAVKVLTPELLGMIMRTNGIPVENILIGSAVYDSSDEGATASNGFIWGKSALFCNVDMSQTTVRGSTLVKTFALKEKPVEFKFYKDKDEDKDGLWGFGKLYYEHNIVDNNQGYLFTTVVD